MTENTEQTQIKGGFTALVVTTVIILTLQSLGVQWVWNHVMAAQLQFGSLNFGHVFVLLATYHVIFRDVFGLFGSGSDDAESQRLLTQIRDIQTTKLQNDVFQYQTTLKIMAELVKERDAARKALEEK